MEVAVILLVLVVAVAVIFVLYMSNSEEESSGNTANPSTPRSKNPVEDQNIPPTDFLSSSEITPTQNNLKPRNDLDDATMGVCCHICGTITFTTSSEHQLLKRINDDTGEQIPPANVYFDGPCKGCLLSPEDANDSDMFTLMRFVRVSPCRRCMKGLYESAVPNEPENFHQSQLVASGLEGMCWDCKREILISRSKYQDSEPKELFMNRNNLGINNWAVSLPVQADIQYALGENDNYNATIHLPRMLRNKNQSPYGKTPESEDLAPFPVVVVITETSPLGHPLVFPDSVDHFTEYTKNHMSQIRLLTDHNARYAASGNMCEEMKIGKSRAYESFYTDTTLGLTYMEWLIETDTGALSATALTPNEYDLQAAVEEIAYSIRIGPYPDLDDSDVLVIEPDGQSVQNTITLKNNSEFYVASNIAIVNNAGDENAITFTDSGIPNKLDPGEVVELTPSTSFNFDKYENPSIVRWQWTLPDYEFIGLDLHLKSAGDPPTIKSLYESQDNSRFPNFINIEADGWGDSSQSNLNFHLSDSTVNHIIRFGENVRLEPSDVTKHISFCRCDFTMKDAHSVTASMASIQYGLYPSTIILPYFHNRLLFESCDFTPHVNDSATSLGDFSRWHFSRTRANIIDSRIAVDMNFRYNCRISIKNSTLQGTYQISNGAEVVLVNCQITDSTLEITSGGKLYMEGCTLSNTKLQDSFQNPLDTLPGQYSHQRIHIFNSTVSGKHIDQFMLQPIS